MALFSDIARSFRSDSVEVVRQDSLVPIIQQSSGLGSYDVDPLASARLPYPRELSQAECDTYYQHWACRRTVDAIPDQMTRRWGHLIIADDSGDAADQLCQTLDTVLKTPTKFNRAQKQANLYGGSGIVLFVDDGQTDASQPVNESQIRSVEGMRLLDRWHIYPVIEDYSRDPWDPTFYRLGQPVSGLAQTGQLIHESRVLPFHGIPVGEEVMRQYSGWSDSVLRGLIEAVNGYELGIYSASGALKDFEIFVHKVANFANIRKHPNGPEGLRTRARENRNLLATFRTFMVDKDAEDLSFLSRKFTGVDSIIDKTVDNIKYASGLPPSMLLQTYPVGLGATGLTERIQTAEMVSGQQETKFRDPLEKLLRYLFLSQGSPTKGIPDSWEWHFESLFELTDLEKAELRKSQAETDRIYVEMGSLNPQQVAESRFGGSDYSPETTLGEDGWQPPQPAVFLTDPSVLNRDAVDLTPPGYMVAHARRGLELHQQGKSGDGLKPETVRWARRIANGGKFTPEKIIQAAAWLARHAASKTPWWNKSGEETPGYVSHLLWFSDGSNRSKAWFERKAAEIKSNS